MLYERAGQLKLIIKRKVDIKMNINEELPLTLTVPEVAEILRINKTKAYELSHRKDFPSIKLGNRIVIPRDAFLRWMDEETNKLI